jgi:predicted dehydrogenase
MGFDDLKVVEARKFLEAFAGKAHHNSNIHDAVAAAAVCDAAEQSAESGQWVTLPAVAGVTAALR